MSTVTLNSVAVEPGEGGLVTLSVEVAADSVRATRERVIKELSRQMRVPGFRPGHVPANIVRRNIGDEAIAQRVSEELVPEAYKQAIRQKELRPLEQGQVQQLTFDAFDGAKPLSFEARVVLRPEVELGQIEGLPVSRPALQVTDEQVDSALESLRHDQAPWREVEGRGARLGDRLAVELQVFVDDQPQSEKPSRPRPFVLGDNALVPSLDEHLLGIELDQERRFNATYPSNFSQAELAGQVAEFAVRATSIKERIALSLDELAEKSGLSDAAAVREKMIEALRHQLELSRDRQTRQQVTEAAVSGARLEVPAHLVETRVHGRIHSLEHDLGHRKLTMDQYLEQSGTTREEMEQSLHQEMEQSLRRQLVLDAIAQQANLEVAPAEIEQHYLALAQTLEQPVEQVLEHYDAAIVSATILENKAVDWLLEHAEVAEDPEAEPSVPA